MKIGIIGAGASGMMAAISAAEEGAHILLFEKNDRVGKKILATGNGKCNFTNLNFGVEQYHCKDFEKLKSIFEEFSNKDTIGFFQQHGMMWRERDGYVYPYSEQASTVLDVLRKLLKQKQIRIITDAEVTDISVHKKQFRIQTKETHFDVDRVILSCGSPAGGKQEKTFQGYQLAKSLGHTIEPVVPSLVQLRSSADFLKGMAGVRTKAEVRLLIDGKEAARERGELQLTDYGISGIPVFQFSSTAGYGLLQKKKVDAVINFFPDFTQKEFEQLWQQRIKSNQPESVEEMLLGLTNKKIHLALLKKNGLKAEMITERIPEKQLEAFKKDLTDLTIPITASNGIAAAQVCAGGVSFLEITEEFESRKCRGLFLTGELLDVDGRCGGYNLQFAWSSGYLAGKAAARG